jgi:hypothetical protein
MMHDATRFKKILPYGLSGVNSDRLRIEKFEVAQRKAGGTS